MVGIIIGNQNPLLGTTYNYEIKPFGLSFGSNKYEWYLYKKQKNGTWKDITGTPKTGEKVTYRFGEPGLGVEFEMKVYETKQGILPGMSSSKQLAGSMKLIPTSNTVPKIEKVVLFNRGARDVNKASYRDTLIAQAHCIGMFNKDIEFHLWEDDAPGKGHNSTINKNNRHTRTYTARVNEKGLAEIGIPLMSDERVLRQMANKFLMKGDQNEGANHEYYVTASYSGKIMGASQTNVDVANPDHKTGQQPTQPKSQPQQNTPKFPTGQGGGPRQPDPKGNIIEAVFVDSSGKELSKVAVGNKVHVRIHSKNMVGKYIQYVIWEYDMGANDEVYRSGNIKIPADLCDTMGFVITKDIFKKGADSLIPNDPDQKTQNYFIEIISKDLAAESKKFGVSSEGLLTVENPLSPSGVQNTPKPNKPGEKCFCNRDFEEKDVRQIVKLLKGSETIWEGQALKGGKRAPCNISDKSFATLTKELNNALKKYKINTCAQKMHFLAQVCEETGTFSLSEETKSSYLSSISVYKGRGLLQLTGVKKKGEEKYDAPGPYKDYADYKGDQNIVKKPEIVANNVHYCIDSGAWLWSVNKKMPNAPSPAVDRWGIETSGKSLNELAVDVDKYLELISVLLNGRNEKTKMPNGWEKRKANYNILKTGFFMYDKFHNDNSKPLNAKDIITYHIYADGIIERHIPKKIKSGYEKKYKYVYHDKDKKEHEICIIDWMEIDKVERAKPNPTSVPKGYISHESFNIPGVNQKDVYKYNDGSIVASGKPGEGKGNILRKYIKSGGKTIIVKIPDPLNYNSGSTKINLIFKDTIRKYMGRDHFACLVGALAESGFSQVTSGGAAMQDGTCFPSVSHTNGSSIDVAYFTHTNTQKFINSMIKFGFNYFLAGTGMSFSKPKGFNGTLEGGHSDHNGHLHGGAPKSLSINIKEIKE